MNLWCLIYFSGTNNGCDLSFGFHVRMYAVNKPSYLLSPSEYTMKSLFPTQKEHFGLARVYACIIYLILFNSSQEQQVESKLMRKREFGSQSL